MLGGTRESDGWQGGSDLILPLPFSVYVSPIFLLLYFFFFFANSLKIVLLFCILHLSALPPPCPHRANILSLLKVFLLQLRFYKPRAFPTARGCTSGRGAGRGGGGQDFEDILAVTNL